MSKWQNGNVKYVEINLTIFMHKDLIIKFNFDLSDYYNIETRIFEFPKGYVAFSLMSDVFNSFLFPLDLVEKVESDE